MPRTKGTQDGRTDPPPGDRIQFSISMPQQLRDQVETLAGLRHMSISDYVNLVMRAHIAAIPTSTWDQIRKAKHALAEQGIQFAHVKKKE